MSVRAIVLVATGGGSGGGSFSSLLSFSSSEKEDPRGISAAARKAFVERGDEVKQDEQGGERWALVFPHDHRRAGDRAFRLTVEPLWGVWRGFRVTVDALGQVLDRDDNITHTPVRDPKYDCYDTPHNRRIGVGLLVGIPPVWDPVLNVRLNAFLTLPCCRCGENRYVTVNGDTLVFYMPSSSDPQQQQQRGARPLCAFLDDWIRAWRGEDRYI
jgi:hypothetical protein